MVLPLILLLAAAVITVLFVAWKLSRRRRVSQNDRQKIALEWSHALSLPAPEAKILEADKVLDHVMSALGAEGSFADKLRNLGPRLKNPQLLWDAHKLRNRIAHETGVRVDRKEVERALRSFEEAMHAFLRS
ncbi:hypothetical protein FJZ28_01470 [Candidatus Peregrinibacteria bacterium]|nr:hypothetical protein [Candidatus Peregrinibacteria bacterium]